MVAIALRKFGPDLCQKRLNFSQAIIQITLAQAIPIYRSIEEVSLSANVSDMGQSLISVLVIFRENPHLRRLGSA
jgi:hypothetical protein